jgi:hypothetical protein
MLRWIALALRPRAPEHRIMDCTQGSACSPHLRWHLMLCAAAIAAVVGCGRDASGLAAPDAPPGSQDVATLVISRIGTGTGTVRSSTGGIDCGTTCIAPMPIDTPIALTATADLGALFVGWSGAGCSGAAMTCTVTLRAAATVTANFQAFTPPFYLTLHVNGTGQGTVTSSAGAPCRVPGYCVTRFDAIARVELTATPDPGSTFTGWFGDGCSGTGTCALGVGGPVEVFAAFTRITYPLTVGREGSGTVKSTPFAILCGATCTAMYPPGAIVMLSAAPATGWTFAGWSGACTGTGDCAVTVTGAASVTASFTAGSFPLTIVTPGAGSGVVTSSPAGIDCGATCTASYLADTVVTLAAAAQPGSTFAGWSGAGCAGTGTCTVTVTGATTVTALFAPTTASLSVLVTGTGAGTVTSSPAGIDCGTTCGTAFALGTVVTLTASPAAGSTFDGWTGACTGTGPCTLTVNDAVLVSAKFTAIVYNLTVHASTSIGPGNTIVTSADGAIDCSRFPGMGHDQCHAVYPTGTAVQLTVIPDNDHFFLNWVGACAGQGVVCQLTMTSDLETSGVAACGEACR